MNEVSKIGDYNEWEDKICMGKDTYITPMEQERCRKVADAFAELYVKEDIVVLDIGRYGFIKLQYYSRPYGFDDVMTFINSKEMFEDLWKDWLYSQLFMIAKGTPMQEMDYEDIYKCLPKEKQKELTDKKAYFADLAEIDIS